MISERLVVRTASSVRVRSDRECAKRREDQELWCRCRASPTPSSQPAKSEQQQGNCVPRCSDGDPERKVPCLGEGRSIEAIHEPEAVGEPKCKTTSQDGERTDYREPATILIHAPILPALVGAADAIALVSYPTGRTSSDAPPGPRPGRAARRGRPRSRTEASRRPRAPARSEPRGPRPGPRRRR